MNTVVIDVGGSTIKLWRTGEAGAIKIKSGKHMTPRKLVKKAKKALEGWQYERGSIGYPGDVQNGQIVAEPYNLGPDWVGFDFAEALGVPVKVLNDACMQALGSYEGGRMLFIGLGTAMGSVFIIDGKMVPLALGELCICNGATFGHYLGLKGFKRYGIKNWRNAVSRAAVALRGAFLADYVVLGGGNARRLKDLPEGCRRGANELAYIGGVRMWEQADASPSLSLYRQPDTKTV